MKLCYNIYQPSALDRLPFFRGIALKTEDPTGKNLQNVNMRGERKDLLEPNTDHFNIEKKDKIHQEAIRRVLAICPPREQWAATRNLGPNPIRASYVQSPVANKPSAQTANAPRTGEKLMSSTP